MRVDLKEYLEYKFEFMQNTSIQVPNGWYIVVHDMLSEIEDIYKHYSIDIHNLDIQYIAEEDGKLHVEVVKCINEVYDIIKEYKKLSKKICKTYGLGISVECTALENWDSCSFCYNYR